MWGNGNAWLFRKERGRELWYKEVAKLLQTSDLVWIYSILKSVHQILLCDSVRERSSLLFQLRRHFPSYDNPKVNTPVLRNTTSCALIFMYHYTRRHSKDKGNFIITMVRTSNIGVQDTPSFERHRPNEIKLKMNVFVGMLQEDSHLHDPATDLGPLR